jgi:hypothetical protein
MKRTLSLKAIININDEISSCFATQDIKNVRASQNKPALKLTILKILQNVAKFHCQAWTFGVSLAVGTAALHQSLNREEAKIDVST